MPRTITLCKSQYGYTHTVQDICGWQIWLFLITVQSNKINVLIALLENKLSGIQFPPNMYLSYQCSMLKKILKPYIYRQQHLQTPGQCEQLIPWLMKKPQTKQRQTD